MTENVQTDNMDGIKVEMVRETTDTPAWDKNGWNHFRYSVTISRGDVKADFPFWGSAVDYKEGKDPQPLEALRSFVSDALCYSDSTDIDDFAGQFGAEKISETIESYNACKNAFEVLGKMGFDQADIPILDVDLSKRLDGK